ncbi:unnamed protein product [Ambrosiozyma monospora]|uniref:Unnamed protein product n=1 Tax=Ambrosiozyma monospora TaxID=43982 RepID=A0ACB5U1M4_AMBMO|nr:unnamed protein product [Ambrosiozyma monospora]
MYSGNNNNNINAPPRRNQSPSKQSLRSMRSQKYLHQQHQNQQTQIQQQQQQQPAEPLKPPLFMCEPFIKTALVKGSYKAIVQLPKYVEESEWLALNTFEFYTHLNKFYGVISEYVTPDKYPTMNADPKTEYVWVMPNGRTVSLPANQYIEYALTWISNKLNDQSTFPTKAGMAFPPGLLKDIKGICRQMFRIIAHIYYNHFEKIVHLSLEAHYISFFAHFISFIREFDLVEKQELEPLSALIENLEGQGRIIKLEN